MTDSIIDQGLGKMLWQCFQKFSTIQENGFVEWQNVSRRSRPRNQFTGLRFGRGSPRSCWRKRIQFGKTARSSQPMESHFEEGNAGLASPLPLLNFSRGSSEGEGQQARAEQRYSRRR
jgi:hypothetical protein